MTLVRMLMTMSGSRHDNVDWPPYGGFIDVPEWEADQLIRGGNAESADEEVLDRGYDVLRVPHPEFETILKRADGSDQDEDEYGDEDDDLAREDEEEETDYDSDFERDDADNEVVVEIKRPYDNAKKDSWIDYAVFKGADPKHVAELTIKQIISKYGA